MYSVLVSPERALLGQKSTTHSVLPSSLEIFAALDYHRSMRKRYSNEYSLGSIEAKSLAIFHSKALLKWKAAAQRHSVAWRKIAKAV